MPITDTTVTKQKVEDNMDL